MAEGFRTYDNRLRSLEKNVVNHDGQFSKFDTRNDTHSARLKMMENELKEIKAENEVLFGEVVNLKTDRIKSRIDDDIHYDPRYYRRQDEENYPKQDIWDSHEHSRQPVDNQVNIDLQKNDTVNDRNAADESDTPRQTGYYRYKAIPYHNRMLLNDNYQNRMRMHEQEQSLSPRGEAQRKKEYDRIELHEGNFKPYASETYYRHLTDRPSVRHRNMEYEYDAQQRLPLNIAPQNDYKSVIQQPSRSESGAYLFIRTKKSAIEQIRLSFQKHKSILKMSGHLKGIATNDKISIIGDFSRWHIHQPMVRKGDNWYEQGVGQEYMTDYIVICLWFPSVETAQLWKAYDVDFKRESFPEYEGCDLLVVPINYIPMNDIDASTFLIMEFPEVINKNALKQYVKDPMDDILTKDSKFERCEPFVVWTDKPKNERGMMVSERSVVAVHRFTSLRQAREFYNDPRIERIRRELKDITRGGRHTTVIFQLVDFV